MTSRQYRLTRDLKADEPGNFFPRDLKAGAILYQCFGAYAVTNVDLSRGACLTEDPDGGYPGYQVPLSAVEEAPGDGGEPATTYDPAIDNCGGMPGCGNQRVLFTWFHSPAICCPRCYENLFGAAPDPGSVITLPAAMPGQATAPAHDEEG